MTAPQEETGVRVLGEAFKRWSQQPPVLVELSKISIYQVIMGLQLATRHPDVPTPSRKAWEAIGQRLTEAICDNPEIYALTQAGWNADFDIERDELANIPVRRQVDGRWTTVMITRSEWDREEGARQAPADIPDVDPEYFDQCRANGEAFRAQLGTPRVMNITRDGQLEPVQPDPLAAVRPAVASTEEQPPGADATVSPTSSGLLVPPLPYSPPATDKENEKR